jgi:hypothetical protein
MMEIAGNYGSGATKFKAGAQPASQGRNDEMHSWLKTSHTVASPLVVRLVSGLASVVVTIILLGSSALSQSDSVGLELSAVDLARKVVSNELKVQNEEQSHWMYRLEKAESRRKQIKKILETKNGSLSQLLSIDGHPLNAGEQQESRARGSHFTH